MTLPAGKLPSEMLETMLTSVRFTDPSVVVRGAIGEDAAVIDTGGPELLVAKTDPITFASEDIGSYLLAVNGNDLATMGAEPRWLLVTALLPEGLARKQAFDIFDSLNWACSEAGVALVGGHTEVTVGLERPIIVGCLLGTVPRERLVRTAGARVGDAILLTGGIAIEGTVILATEHTGALRANGVHSAAVERAAGWLQDPGISVLAASRAAHATGAVHSMHDPTEGGLVTGLHELAEAAGAGLRISRKAIPILPECALICDALELDPLGLLASGALLITLDPAEVPAAFERLKTVGIPVEIIGEVVSAAEGRTFDDQDRVVSLPTFARDELARYLEGLS
jgi:hydrogenase expression/formation protein HypE